jgi:hypothetical protein
MQFSNYKLQHQIIAIITSIQIYQCHREIYDMNHTTLALVAVLVAAALVIGAVATPAFAGGHEKRDKYDKKGDSSKTIYKQSNKQKQVIIGDNSEGEQFASNCIVVVATSNPCQNNVD